jgi:hypothetical protein
MPINTFGNGLLGNIKTKKTSQKSDFAVGKDFLVGSTAKRLYKCKSCNFLRFSLIELRIACNLAKINLPQMTINRLDM